MSKEKIDIEITIKGKGKSDVIHTYTKEIHRDYLPNYIISIGSDIIKSITYMLLKDENYPTRSSNT